MFVQLHRGDLALPDCGPQSPLSFLPAPRSNPVSARLFLPAPPPVATPRPAPQRDDREMECCAPGPQPAAAARPSTALRAQSVFQPRSVLPPHRPCTAAAPSWAHAGWPRKWPARRHIHTCRSIAQPSTPGAPTPPPTPPPYAGAPHPPVVGECGGQKVLLLVLILVLIPCAPPLP